MVEDHAEVDGTTPDVYSLQGNHCGDSDGADSPLHRVPFEILGRIFEIAITPGMTREDMKKLTSICLVCRTWREAALAHHQLWSSLEVNVPVTPPVREKVEAWLSRSGTLPKSLVATSPYHEWCLLDDDLDESPCPFASKYLADMLTGGPTLEHLSLCCPSSECLLNLTSRLLAKARATRAEERRLWSWDRLKSLRLVVTREWAEEEPYEEVDKIFKALPPVASLHIHLPGFKTHIPPDSPSAAQRRLVIPPPSLARLTRLTFDCNWHYKFVLDTLRPCINLEVLTLHFKSSSLGYRRYLLDPQEGTVKEVTFPRLTVLRLRQANPIGLRILRRFKNPMLAELDLSFEFAGWTWRSDGRSDWTTWVEHIGANVNVSRCRGTLRRFRLHASTISSWDFESFLAYYFPDLKELTLESVRFFDQDTLPVLLSLIVPMTRTNVVCLPLLKTLHYTQSATRGGNTDNCRPGTNITYEDLSLAIRSRRNGWSEGESGSRVRIITTMREVRDPPQLEDEDSDWESDEEFDSWDFNMGVREPMHHILEHDCL